MKNSSKFKIEAKQNVFTLTVNKCDHPDVGTYRVQVDNGIDHTDQTGKLNVGGKFHSFSYTLFHSLLFQSNQKSKQRNPQMNNHVLLGKIHRSHGSLVVLKNLKSHGLSMDNLYLPMNDIKSLKRKMEHQHYLFEMLNLLTKVSILQKQRML